MFRSCDPRNQEQHKMDLEEEQLIVEVQSRPSLYNKSLSDYKKVNKREDLWKEVAAVVNADVNLCKKRWRSLRDGFIKNHRQIKSCPSGSAGGKKKEWVYYKLLQFLIPHIEFKETAGNYSQAEDIGDATEDAAIASTSTEQEDLPLQFTEETFNVTREDTPIEANNTHLRQETATTVSKRRGVKRRVTASESTEDKLLNILSKESDDNELFLMSLLPTLKRLRPRQNIQARIKIQQLLQDIEFDSNFSASSPRNDNIEYTYL